MANLTSNLGREFLGPITKARYEVHGNIETFTGQAVSQSTNDIKACVADEEFVGFGAEYVNNLTNSIPHGGANRAAKADVMISGYVWLTVGKASGGNWAATDQGKTVYATDGNVFDIVDAGTRPIVGTIANLDNADFSGAADASILVKFG